MTWTEAQREFLEQLEEFADYSGKPVDERCEELADRAGHARASMSLDVYSHVMPLDEVPAGRLVETLA